MAQHQPSKALITYGRYRRRSGETLVAADRFNYDPPAFKRNARSEG